MDRDKDAKLTYDEFVEGSKQDPTIVQVSYRHVHVILKYSLDYATSRLYHYTMDWYSLILIDRDFFCLL